MSVIKFFEQPDKGSAKVDSQNRASYTRVIGVQFNSPKVRQGTAVTAVVAEFGCTIGSHYKVVDPDDVTITLEEDLASYVQSIGANASAEDGCQWDVTIEYGPGEFAKTEDYNDAFPANPIDHKLKVSWGSARFSKAVQYDINGDAIKNSADDFPERTPEKDDSRTVLKVVRNQATFPATLAQTYKNTVNSGTFTLLGESFPPKTVKCTDITADLEYHAEAGFYWSVSYEFEVNPDTWAAKFLDEGYQTMDATTHKKTKIVDESGQPVSTSQLLNGSGQKLGHGSGPVVLSFDIYGESDFADFDFDSAGTPGY